MLLDLKAHYLDLIVGAIEAGGNACLHRPSERPDNGRIYVTVNAGNTSTEFVLTYSFGETAYSIAAEFADGRPSFLFSGHYVDGLEKFWPAFRKALSANRLEDHSDQPERGPQGDYTLVAAR